MRILVACEESQAVTIEFRNRGIEAFSCDIQQCSGGHSEWHFNKDVFEVIGMGWDGMVAFPPCTHLAVSGAAWFEQKRKDGRQKEGIDFFMALVNAPIEKIAIENPIGIMSSLYRKPDQIIQPWQHGHAETKSTCLWLKNLPLLLPTNVVEPDFMKKPNGEYYLDAMGKKYSRIHFMSRSNPDRAKFRSKTYPGIAQAIAQQWFK